MQFISFPEVLRNASQGDAYCGNIADTAVFAWLGSRLFQSCGVRQNHACRRLKSDMAYAVILLRSDIWRCQVMDFSKKTKVNGTHVSAVFA